MYKNKSHGVRETIDTASIEKQKLGVERPSFREKKFSTASLSISNKVLRCPVLSPLERLAADMAWNG